MRTSLVALAAIAWVGCLSQSSLDGLRIPDEVRESGTFTVRHQVNDKRNLDGLIEQGLRRRGLSIASNAAEADYVVSYVDRWYWDMRNYLIDLRIDVRDAGTHVLVATGRSYQTSLAAMGETHETVIDRTIEVLVEGPAEDGE